MSLLQQKPLATALEEYLRELSDLLGGRLSKATNLYQLHQKDASFHEIYPPDAIDFVESNEEIAEIVHCKRDPSWLSQINQTLEFIENDLDYWI
jgi:hypothetical protein